MLHVGVAVPTHQEYTVGAEYCDRHPRNPLPGKLGPDESVDRVHDRARLSRRTRAEQQQSQ